MAGDTVTGDAQGSPGWREQKGQEKGYLWSFGSAWSRGAGGEWQPRALHVTLGAGGEGAELHLAPAPVPPTHHRGGHLRIQPRSPALGGPGAPGALAARGVPWAQEGRLSPFLLGLLVVLFLPCCPAKGTRTKQRDR